MKTRISEEEFEAKKEEIIDILIDVARSAHWYGEDTKDYDMKQVEKEDFFIEALDTIIFLLIHKGG